MMALTRQRLQHLTYLFEFAPIVGSPVRAPCHASFCAQNRLKRRLNQDVRTLQTTTTVRKPQASNNSKSGAAKGHHGRPSATSALVSDAATLQQPSTATSTSPLSNSPLESMILSRSAKFGSGVGEFFETLAQMLADAKVPLQKDKPVTEQEALNSLKLCIDLAKGFKGGKNSTVADLPAIKLLFEDEMRPDAKARPALLEDANIILDQALRRIAGTARAVITDPKVFITPKLLESYVRFRAAIEHPDDLAEIFKLYANKPIPMPNSSPVRYSPASPDKASFAIPLETAELALEAAIATRNLSLCLDIIKESVSKTAFKRHKLIQQALLPFTGVAVAPVAAYALASQFAVFQANLDTDTAKWVGFAGIMSYIAFTGTIGIVALTTSNDQMERVVWQDGTPLRERWLREQERRMLDQIAVAWGFKDPYRKGEEEGPDWDALKELTSLRGMILDKIELMEGMS